MLIGRISASAFSPRRMAVSSSRSARLIRSILLIRMTSANSTCSISRSVIERSSCSPRVSPWLARLSAAWKSRRKFSPSTTVTIVSSRARSDRLRPASSRKVKVSATGSGSEMPVDSISR
ncbi:hypothetical protein D3C76_1293100 [compost metagenome]